MNKVAERSGQTSPMNSKFVHLHVHSHYSFLRALPAVDELVKAAKAQNMEALALTDGGAVYGIIEFYKECKKKEIKPIVGQCANLALHLHTDKRPRIDDKTNQLVLLCETDEGYKNLLALTTKAHLDGFYYVPRLDKELLRQHHRGLIGLSGGLRGDICKALMMDEFGKAEELVREYVDIFGEGNFFLEIQDHPELDEQVARNRDLIRLSEKTGVPLVATKDVHYVKPSDAEAHDVLLAVGDGRTLDDERRSRMTDADYSLVDEAHMLAAFADVPQAVENTVKIAERCNVTIEIGKWHFADFKTPHGETHADYLRTLANEGLREKLKDVTPAMQERLDYELGIIEKKGYATYFLVVSDYIRWAKEHKIVTTTRGSAAGSLVSYCVDIVPVNPLTYKLPFERFLNPFRMSAPDVDADFEDSRRDEVIAYVTEKYGKEKVAQICTFGTMAARGSVRDVGRALGLPIQYVDRVSKMIPMGSQGFAMTIRRAIEETPDLKNLIDTDPQAKRLLELAQRIEGRVRQAGVHAAGVVISPTPLTDFTALQHESGGDKLITQYDMNAIGEDGAGVLKMDFLGIRNLSILGRAVQIIRRTKGVDIDLQHIPLDDKPTYEMLGRGETIGLFQLNGSGMTKYLVDLKPSRVEDIMAMVALYRPGPIESIPEFIRRKHNPELVTYLDPRLKDILDMSYGVLTYQDDVMLTAIHLAGYNWEEADKFRKAMGKKIPEEMMKQKDKFLTGCVKGGMKPEIAQQLWALIEPFAAYGFNKAHACAYGMVAYQTAYLKANWPAEYMTAVLTEESGDVETVAQMVEHCRTIGIDVLPPDVNSSRQQFTYIDDKSIRFGLGAIKNLGEDIAAAIIAERDAHGEFKSLSDFAARVDSKGFNKRALESLIKAGAMEGMGERNLLLTNIDQILAFHKAAVKDAATGQSNLFGAAPVLAVKAEVTLRPVPPATKREKLTWERELLGLYVSEHPYKEYGEYFAGLLTPIKEIEAASREKRGGMVRVGGYALTMQDIITKKGDPMAFAVIGDVSGTIECVIFPSVLAKNKALWRTDIALMVEGKFSDKDGEHRLLVESAEEMLPENLDDIRRRLGFANGQRDLAPARTGFAEQAQVRVLVPPKLPRLMADELKRVMGEHPGGRRVVLEVRDSGAVRHYATSFSIAFSSDTIADIESVVGKGAVLAE